MTRRKALETLRPVKVVIKTLIKEDREKTIEHRQEERAPLIGKKLRTKSNIFRALSINKQRPIIKQ